MRDAKRFQVSLKCT